MENPKQQQMCNTAWKSGAGYTERSVSCKTRRQNFGHWMMLGLPPSLTWTIALPVSRISESSASKESRGPNIEQHMGGKSAV